MNLYKFLFATIILLLSIQGYTQGTNCANSDPFCTGTVTQFSAGTNVTAASVAEPGNNYGCLTTSPNPAWYYLEIDQPGNLDIDITNSGNVDIDFALWGPFPNLSAAMNNCGSLGSPIDCSYSATTYPEQANIVGANTGDVYILLITNFSNSAVDISFTNVGGNATTDCSILAPCSITSLTANTSPCNPANNTYNLSGSITFIDPPTTDSLIVTDCNGNSQIFTAPFVSPLNYNITGLNSDGLPCSVNAVFTADTSCNFTTNFNAPAPCGPPCNFDSLTVQIGPCNSNNSYDLNGMVYFSNPPTTGTLTITDNCSGLDTVIFAPFSSPMNWGIYNLPTGNGNCDITAVFSADPNCTITLSNYPQTAPCPCNADVGTFTPTTTGNTLYPNRLCFGDQFTLTSNGNNVHPNQANNPPPGPPNGYNPGIGYLIYSCPPTIFPQQDFTTDPCFVGVVGFGNNFNDLNFLGAPSYAGPWNNNTVYYVPITFYDTLNTPYLYSYTNTSTNCYDMGTPFAVQYLTEITSVIVPDCQDSSLTVTLTGGLPEFDGSLYTASNLLPATANFVNTTTNHGGTIVINGLQDGDMYSFDVVDTNGCPITITGGPFVGLPDANANVDDTSCTLTYNLNAIASVGNGTWSTLSPGVVFAPNNTPNSTVTVPTPGTYTFTWTEDNGNGCISSDDVIITFNILSIPNTPTNPLCNGGNDGQIILAPQGGSAPYSYQWDANANNQTTNPAINLGAGSYNVTVTDAFGCFVDSLFTLIEPAPFTFTTDSTNSNCGLPDGTASVLNFAGGTPGYTYDWGSGPTPNNVLTNLIPGVYTVTVEDANGCDTTISITVGNNLAFTASIINFNDALCFGDNSGSATANGSDPIATYNFSWNTSPVQNTQTATGLTAGTYICTVVDASTGCIDTVSITINEPPLLTVNAGADINICIGGNTNISAIGAGGTPPYNYSWDNGLGAGQNHNVSPIVTTSYIVTITDDNGCQNNDTIIVNVHPPLTVIASNDVSICPGDITNISAIAAGGNGGPYTYTWDNGLGLGQNHNVSPTATTTYIVTANDGCSQPVTDTVIITVNPVPVVDFIADTFGLCEFPQLPFEFYNITDTTGGMVSSALWNFGDGGTASGDTVSHTYSSPGTYDITLTVTSTPNAGGCSATLTKPAYVTVFPNPVADFSMNPNPASMFDPTIFFNDLSYHNIVNWYWDIGGLDTSSLQNPIYTFPEDTGNYNVILTVTDINGCVSTISNTAIVKGEFGIYIPNAFTPDYDGLNEGFFPKGFGISDNKYNFYIFNRWGELIFESHSKFEPWNGTYKGNLVQNGVYVWRLEFKDINGENHTKIGHVNVIK